MPWAPWVTAVTARPGFSKLSALAPLVPVMALKVMAVSSGVVTLSATMSGTGVTVRATVSVSVRVPSVVATVRSMLPAPVLKSAVGV